MTNTKAVNLTEDEINVLIVSHGQKLYNVAEVDMRIERINYLNKRLKTFKEPEEAKQDATADNAVKGWGEQTND